MAVFHLPLSLVQSLALGIAAPTKVRFHSIPGALSLWFVVMTTNQCVALAWLLGYGVLIKSWAYSTSSGDAISAFYFVLSALASTALIYKFRHELCRLLS